MGLNSGGSIGRVLASERPIGRPIQRRFGFFRRRLQWAEKTAPLPCCGRSAEARKRAGQYGECCGDPVGKFIRAVFGAFSAASSVGAEIPPPPPAAAEAQQSAYSAAPAPVQPATAPPQKTPSQGASQADEGRACQASPGGRLGIGATGVRSIGGVRRRRGSDRLQRGEQRSVRPRDRQEYQGSALRYSHQSRTRRCAKSQRRISSRSRLARTSRKVRRLLCAPRCKSAAFRAVSNALRPAIAALRVLLKVNSSPAD